MARVGGTHTVAYEHPEYGVCYVTFMWRATQEGLTLVPQCVEFDLFTPVLERIELEEILQVVRERISATTGVS